MSSEWTPPDSIWLEPGDPEGPEAGDLEGYRWMSETTTPGFTYLLATPEREAAPELLEALKFLLQQVDAHAAAGEVMPSRTVDTDRARAAIAKAEGKP